MNTKRKVLCSVLAGFLAFLMLFSLFALLLNASASDKSELEDLKDKLSDIQKQRKAKEDELAAMNDEMNTLLDKKYGVEQEISLTYEQIHITEEIIDTLEGNIQTKEEEIAAVEVTKDAQYETFKKRLRAQYESNGISDLELILTSSSLTEALARIEALNRIASHDNELIDDLNETIAYIETLKADLETDKAEQEEQKQEYEKYSQDLRDQETVLSGLIAELKTKAAFTQEEIDKITDDENAVDKEIQALSAKIAAAEAAAAAAAQKENVSTVATGSMAWPLPGHYTITSDYTMRNNPITGVYGHHTGIDISAPKGTSIVAAGSGTVVSAGWNNAYGWRIIISHGGGIQTLYAHMTSFAVSEGDYVNAGDTIGYVGSTGNSTGNHLHFSVLVNGSYVSPWGYVSV